MDIQLRFLQKAIEDKNYVSFTYKGKRYEKIKASEIKKLNFDFKLIKNLVILKNKFI
jgi:hypothetical protein